MDRVELMMDNDFLKEVIESLREENERLKKENKQLKEQLSDKQTYVLPPDHMTPPDFERDRNPNFQPFSPESELPNPFRPQGNRFKGPRFQ